GDVAQLQHRVIHLRDTGSLLGSGSADFTDEVGDLLDLGHDAVHGLAGRVHQPAAVFNLLNAIVDECLDVLRCGRTLLGQAAHFARDDREPAALLAGTRCLDGRVQRQDVRLESDGVNDGNDVNDALGGFIDTGHRGYNVVDHFPALFGGTAGRHRPLCCLT